MVGDRFALCMRVQSDMPKVLEGSGETGWLHRLNGHQAPRPARKEREEVVNLRVLPTMERWRALYAHYLPLPFEELGVSHLSLTLIECCPTCRANVWAFPMKSGDGNYVGLRLRSSDGNKWAEPGSHAGLFIPTSQPHATIFIVEGPTDTAAMLTMGLWALGRPSCSGGIPHIQQWLQRHRGVVKRVVIVADADLDKRSPDGRSFNPGITGAKTLQEHLYVPSVILTLPKKDPREFLKSGGTGEMITMLSNQLVWKKHEIQSKNSPRLLS